MLMFQQGFMFQQGHRLMGTEFRRMVVLEIDSAIVDVPLKPEQCEAC